MKEDAVDMFHHYGFHLFSSFLLLNLMPFQGEKNYIFPASFPRLHAFGQLVVHPPPRIVCHPKDEEVSLTSTRSSANREGRWHSV